MIMYTVSDYMSVANQGMVGGEIPTARCVAVTPNLRLLAVLWLGGSLPYL